VIEQQEVRRRCQWNPLYSWLLLKNVITDLIRLSIEFDSSIELNSTERTKKKASLFVKQEWYLPYGT